MDGKLQTSFIPKKPITETTVFRRPQTVSIFTLISIIIFIISLASAAGVFLYQRYLVGQIADMNSRLAKAKNAFEPSFVTTVTNLSNRIAAAKKILDAHTVVSPLFDLLAGETLQNVRFDNFSYQLSDAGASTISMSGQAKSFNAVALQSDVFGQDKRLKNPVFSDLNLDQSGNVIFKFTATVDASYLSYRKNLSGAGAASDSAGPAALAPAASGQPTP